jgi:hypothetical protein
VRLRNPGKFADRPCAKCGMGVSSALKQDVVGDQKALFVHSLLKALNYPFGPSNQMITVVF